MNTAKKIIGYFLLGGISLMLLYSAYEKFSAGDMVLQMFEMLNLSQYLVVLGIVEILSVVMLWVPKYRKAGVLLATGYLGGAIMATIALGMVPHMPGWTLVALWLIPCFLGYKMHGSTEKCNCKEGCNCDKGVCTC